MIIKFKNWEKNQPRKDIKKPWYFSFQNEFFIDSKLYELDVEELLTLVYLLCEASRANKNGELFISKEHYRVHGRMSDRMPDRVLNRTISKLQRLQIIEQPRVRGMYVKCDESVQQNRIEENIQDKTRLEERESSVDDSLSIFEIWNSNCKSLPKSQVLSEKRIKTCKLRWKEMPDKNYWHEVIRKISESEFANGKNDRGWKATLDFILQPDRHLQIMEGKFDNKKNEIKKTDYKKLLEDL